MEALDHDQAEQRERDEKAREEGVIPKGVNPDRWRSWMTWRHDEPTPL